jgi:hypothetical protein
MAKKITITMTESEFKALASACSLAEVNWEDGYLHADLRRLAALDRLWAKIKTDWNRA